MNWTPVTARRLIEKEMKLKEGGINQKKLGSYLEEGIAKKDHVKWKRFLIEELHQQLFAEELDGKIDYAHLPKENKDKYMKECPVIDTRMDKYPNNNYVLFSKEWNRHSLHWERNGSRYSMPLCKDKIYEENTYYRFLQVEIKKVYDSISAILKTEDYDKSVPINISLTKKDGFKLIGKE